MKDPSLTSTGGGAVGHLEDHGLVPSRGRGPEQGSGWQQHWAGHLAPHQRSFGSHLPGLSHLPVCIHPWPGSSRRACQPSALPPAGGLRMGRRRRRRRGRRSASGTCGVAARRGWMCLPRSLGTSCSPSSCPSCSSGCRRRSGGRGSRQFSHWGPSARAAPPGSLPSCRAWCKCCCPRCATRGPWSAASGACVGGGAGGVSATG